MKIAIISLGCPKNQVDADRFCRGLLEAGHETVPEPALADVVVINTCGFIESAKEEAIEYIFDTCALRKENPGLRVVVSGCLAERYREELTKEIPEIDAAVGIGCDHRMPQIVTEAAARGAGELPLEFFAPKTDLVLEGPRVISTPRHYAWLKIADGCGNACSYCAIPAIRGPLRSRPLQGVLAEAEWLAQQGVRELVLVAQDVTAYGDDAGQNQTVALLEALDKIEGLRWVRLLYAYPERITEELLQAVRRSVKVIPYFDLPIQHCNEEILTSMRRKGGAAAVRKAIAMIREIIPEATLRTSLIAGYPGESEAQFEELCDFVQQVGFDRLGCFAYSPEEGTPAARLPNQLPDEERRRRADIIMRTQEAVMARKQQAMVGQTLEVVCDGPDESGEWWLCRGMADAPEIDANVLVDSAATMRPGGFYTVRVTGADGYDLLAEYTGDVE